MRFLFPIILTLLMIPFASAYINREDLNLVPKLSFYGGFKEQINKKEEIVLELTLTNDKNFWICWEEWSYTHTLSHEEKTETESRTYKGNECLAPNFDKIIYLPFSKYNFLNEDERLGHWRIEKPTINFYNIKCFSNEDFDDNLCIGKSYTPFIGNYKSFSVITEEPIKHQTWEGIKEKILKGWGLVISIFAGLGIIFGAIYYIIKVSTRKKR